jgi:hypothetical protein
MGGRMTRFEVSLNLKPAELAILGNLENLES